MLTFGTFSLRSQLSCPENMKLDEEPMCPWARWQLASIASHGSEPSWMLSSVKTSDDCSRGWCVIVVHKKLSKHHPSQPSQPTQLWEKISWYFKLVNFVMAYYAAIHNCNNPFHIQFLFLNKALINTVKTVKNGFVPPM